MTRIISSPSNLDQPKTKREERNLRLWLDLRLAVAGSRSGFFLLVIRQMSTDKWPCALFSQCCVSSDARPRTNAACVTLAAAAGSESPAKTLWCTTRTQQST